MKMQQATQESYDVRVYDGGCLYYLDFPKNVEEMTPQEVADDFLEKYDGVEEVEFSVTFTCDESEYNFIGMPGESANEA